MRLAGWLRERGRDVVAFALPQRCPGCGAESEPQRFLCEPCRAGIPRLSIPLCATCLVEEREPAGCLRHPGCSVWARWLYDPLAESLVHALKYQERWGLALDLGREMAGALPPGYRPDLVLEVPLHPARRRERGYNQAALLADAVAEWTGAPRVHGALRRVRATPPQAWLGSHERRANLARAFALGRPRELEGREVLIVDDVLTTGATLEACLRPLRAAGARATGLVLAWAQ
ncbi:MAG TPA: ComF family protein [Candidatus Limnocylindria bacterium]|nr:ComF family protein [Candidatus Limnocylindria bacterium]